MSKKLFFILLTVAVIFFGSFYIVTKLEQKRLRQEQYKQAQNKKAEEITLTFLEGWTNKDIAAYLEKQGIVSSAGFLAEVNNFEAAGIPKNSTPLQGYLYPDTYRFFKSITDRSQTTEKEASETIIKKQLSNFEAKLPADAENLAKKQGLSLYQAIILASIVEKEANNYPNEKKTIAGIFYNRLNIGMALQSDATINYATGKSEASPSLDDLEINSPYNTYKHKGLPPTPINNPSIASINAVLNPIDSGYLYYLHDQKTGRPYYAKTFEEHIVNKQKYLK